MAEEAATAWSAPQEGAQSRGPNFSEPMEHAHDLVRPWRRATIAVSAIAAPLDGMRPAQLMGAHLVLILGS